MKEVNELVERIANAMGFHLLDTGVYAHAKDASKMAHELAVIALDDPYLALIDMEQTASCSELEDNSIKGQITQDYLNGRLSLLNAGFKKVITLTEAIKEARR